MPSAARPGYSKALFTDGSAAAGLEIAKVGAQLEEGSQQQQGGRQQGDIEHPSHGWGHGIRLAGRRARALIQISPRRFLNCAPPPSNDSYKSCVFDASSTQYTIAAYQSPV